MSGRQVQVCLYGGLGNQLFQVGAALLYSQDLNQDTVILDFYRDGRYKTSHPPLLQDVIDIDASFFRIKRNFSFYGFTRLPRMFGAEIWGRGFVNDHNFHVLVSRTLDSKKLFLDGYFQDNLNQILFDRIRDKLKQVLRTKYIEEPIFEQNKLVIHVRGGDFLNSQHGAVCDKAYYIHAINQIQELDANLEITVVTNDALYAESLMTQCGLDKPEIVQSSDHAHDFKLIGAAQYRILSNSTFAFWASEFGANSAGVCVICPKFLSLGRPRPFLLTNELVL